MLLGKKNILRSFLLLMANARAYSLALVCAITGLVVTRLAEASIYKYLIPQTLDEGFIEHQAEFLKRMPALVLGIFIAIGLGEFLSKYFMGYIARSVVRDYRRKMLHHLLNVPTAYYKKHSVGELISKINYDAEQVATAVSDAVREFLSSIIAIFVLFAVMLSISWKISVAVLLVVPVVSYSLRIIGSKMRRYSNKVQQSMSELTHVSAEVISGYQVIKLYQGHEYEQARIDAVNEHNRDQELKTFFITALSSPLMQFIGGVVLVGFIYMVTMDSLKLLPGQIFGLIGVLFALIRPLKQITSVNNIFQKGMVGIESIQKLLDEPVEKNSSNLKLAHKAQRLDFVAVGFAYPETIGTPVLHDVSFSAKRGETVAIVGSSGSGKSSLMSLLPRFYSPTTGRILLDDHDIQNIELNSLREQISLITQQVILFDDTVANNIAYGQKNVPLEKIKYAAKVANALDFIEQLPQGFDTNIGENGCLLSGGQRQRLAIARAVLKDAPILIMDEATSALDTESELAIKLALNNLMQDRITIIIAHRLSTIEHADKILVLDKGRIVQSGSHAELINLPGRYAQLQFAN